MTILRHIYREALVLLADIATWLLVLAILITTALALWVWFVL